MILYNSSYCNSYSFIHDNITHPESCIAQNLITEQNELWKVKLPRPSYVWGLQKYIPTENQQAVLKTIGMYIEIYSFSHILQPHNGYIL